MNAALNPYQLFPFDYRVREAVPVICRHFLNYHEIPGDCQLILIALSVFYQLQECVFQRLGRLIEACQHHIVGCHASAAYFVIRPNWSFVRLALSGIFSMAYFRSSNMAA